MSEKIPPSWDPPARIYAQSTDDNDEEDEFGIMSGVWMTQNINNECVEYIRADLRFPQI